MTNDTTPTLTFSSDEPGSTFVCSINSAGFSAGNCAQPIGPLPLGANTFAVIATDRAGNASAAALRNFTVIDTTAPETTITAGPASGSTTTDRTPSFGFASSEAGSSFRCSIDAGAFAACTSPHTTAALADGSHTFAVKAADPAANEDATPDSRAFTVDAPGPDPDPAPDCSDEDAVVAELAAKLKKAKAKKKMAKQALEEAKGREVEGAEEKLAKAKKKVKKLKPLLGQAKSAAETCAPG